MSRHRNVRGMNYEDEYYDEDEVYGHSVEDDYCISPGTAAQFTYSRHVDLSSFMDEKPIPEEEEEEDENDHDSLNSSHGQKSILNDIDQAKMNSCLEEMRNVLGETCSERVLQDAILKHNFNLEASLNEILSTGEASKPQRLPKESRRNRAQGDDNDDFDDFLNSLCIDSPIKSKTSKNLNVKLSLSHTLLFQSPNNAKYPGMSFSKEFKAPTHNTPPKQILGENVTKKDSLAGKGVVASPVARDGKGQSSGTEMKTDLHSYDKKLSLQEIANFKEKTHSLEDTVTKVSKGAMPTDHLGSNKQAGLAGKQATFGSSKLSLSDLIQLKGSPQKAGTKVSLSELAAKSKMGDMVSNQLPASGNSLPSVPVHSSNNTQKTAPKLSLADLANRQNLSNINVKSKTKLSLSDLANASKASSVMAKGNDDDDDDKENVRQLEHGILNALNLSESIDMEVDDDGNNDTDQLMNDINLDCSAPNFPSSLSDLSKSEGSMLGSILCKQLKGISIPKRTNKKGLRYPQFSYLAQQKGNVNQGFVQSFNQIASFDFSTKSPDDVVKEKQTHMRQRAS